MAEVFYSHQIIIEFMQTRRTYCILALFLLLSSVTLASTRFEPTVSGSNGESIMVHFIDVGQGDSILIDTSGLDVLVDGGTRSAGDVVVEYLGDLSITKIDLMVATHMDADHIGGLIRVLSSTIQVDEVLINNQTHDSGTYDDFMSFASNHTFNVAQRGDVYILTQTVNLTVLNPIQTLEFSTQNENSVVMRLQTGESSFLLMGDAEVNTEASILQSGLEVDSDLLKVGHHGSNTATSDAFLDVVSPSIAIISAGLNNQFGHPHQETLDKLFARGITVYGTYKSGTIVATANSTTIEFPTELQPVPEFTLITREFEVPAFAGQQRPCAPRAGRIIGAAIVLLAVTVPVVAMPYRSRGRFDPQQGIGNLQGRQNQRVIGAAQPEAHQLQEVDADLLGGRQFPTVHPVPDGQDTGQRT